MLTQITIKDSVTAAAGQQLANTVGIFQIAKS
jgi:hypothetical protein